MEKPDIHVLIMAGGRGERFWPKSREKTPKQFLNLKGKDSLLKETFARLKGWVPPSKIWVMTGRQHVALAVKACPGLKRGNVIGEPQVKDTAPCVAVAAAIIAKKNPKAVMVVLPADHWITPKSAFQNVLKEASELAVQEKALITVGIKPDSPHTGYGYIQVGRAIRTAGKNQFFNVRAFKEKPDKAKARQYVRSGKYFWNGGIFVWQADVILSNLKKFKPKIARWALKAAEAWGTSKQQAVLNRAFRQFEKISIDYAVMEKAKNVFVAKAPFQWDDLGSWSSLGKYLKQIPGRNAVSGNVICEETKNSIIVSPGKLVAALGVSNLVIVETPDVTLVVSKQKEQQIKHLLSRIRKEREHKSVL